MFRFTRQKILPLFLQKRMTVAELARRAGISNQTAQRAVEGKKVGAVIVSKVADALGINALDFIEEREKNMMTKKVIEIEDSNGEKKDVEIFVDESGKTFAYWGDEDADALKAYEKYLAGFTATKPIQREED